MREGHCSSSKSRYGRGLVSYRTPLTSHPHHTDQHTVTNPPSSLSLSASKLPNNCPHCPNIRHSQELNHRRFAIKYDSCVVGKIWSGCVLLLLFNILNLNFRGSVQSRRADLRSIFSDPRDCLTVAVMCVFTCTSVVSCTVRRPRNTYGLAIFSTQATRGESFDTPQTW